MTVAIGIPGRGTWSAIRQQPDSDVAAPRWFPDFPNAPAITIQHLLIKALMEP